MEAALAAAAVVAMGTGNRVLYKLALVPLREYPFFLAQFATFGYSSSLLICSPLIDQRCFVLLLLVAVFDRIEQSCLDFQV